MSEARTGLKCGSSRRYRAAGDLPEPTSDELGKRSYVLACENSQPKCHLEGPPMKATAVLGVVLLFALSACGNVKVYRVDTKVAEGTEHTEKTTRLDGIPFYIKVPQWTQSTVLLKKELTVIVITTEADGTRQSWPASGALRVVDSDESRRELDALAQELKRPREVADLSCELETRLRRLAQLQSNTEVISNTWSMAMVTGEIQHQISAVQPLFGTNNTEFNFDAEGTMQKVMQNTTDKTAETLLALFPVADKLKQRWGVVAPPSDGGNAAKVNTPPQDAASDKCGGRYAARKSSGPVTVDLEISEVRRTFSLKKILSGRPTPPLKALTWKDAESGKVQLVESVTVSADKDTTKAPDGGDAYVIEGRITPPSPKAKEPEAKAATR